MSAHNGGTTHAYDNNLRPLDRTASQTVLVSCTDCPAEQALIWKQAFDDHCIKHIQH